MDKRESDKLVSAIVAEASAELNAKPGIQLELCSTEMAYERDGKLVRLWKATSITGGRYLVELKVVGLGGTLPDMFDEQEGEEP